jgi:tetratricopeptide (TPR) repeat protein
MAEERRAGGQNIWLLASLGLNLALVVVVVLGVLFYNVRKGPWGHSSPSIELIAMARDVEAGEKLKAEDLEVRTVPKQYQDSFGMVVMGEDLNFAVGQTVNRNIEKGRWLQWDYIAAAQTAPALINPYKELMASDQQYAKLMTDGREAMKKSQWAKARAFFEEARKIRDTAEVKEAIAETRYGENFARGVEAMEQKDYKVALGYFKLAQAFKNTPEVQEAIRKAEQADKAASPG